MFFMGDVKYDDESEEDGLEDSSADEGKARIIWDSRYFERVTQQTLRTLFNQFIDLGNMYINDDDKSKYQGVEVCRSEISGVEQGYIIINRVKSDTDLLPSRVIGGTQQGTMQKKNIYI